MRALDELEEVIEDAKAPVNVRDAARSVQRAILDRFPPCAELIALVMRYRNKEQDRYGK